MPAEDLDEWGDLLSNEPLTPRWAIRSADGCGRCSNCDKLSTLRLRDKRWWCLDCWTGQGWDTTEEANDANS